MKYFQSAHNALDYSTVVQSELVTFYEVGGECRRSMWPRSEVRMIGCGISISGGEASLIWVDLSDGAVLQNTKKKVQLEDPYLQGDLVQTSDFIRQLIAERKTGIVVVRKSSVSGKFPASHVAFRLETLIALSSPVEVKFIAPQAVAAFVKNHKSKAPDSVLKYQLDGYFALIAAMGV